MYIYSQLNCQNNLVWSKLVQSLRTNGRTEIVKLKNRQGHGK